ncbi:MAG: carbohydrate ABC transporter substrate-binding protein, partial [Alphaproteobacteria bacterium]
MKKRIVVALASAFLLSAASVSFAGMEDAKKWVDSEFQPSAISKADQMKEMDWFVKASAPFKGMEINVLSEGVPTHDYESKTLTKAFEEITGIKVNHQILGEG